MKAGEGTKYPYKFTPLEFVSQEDWSWTLYWTYWMNILRKLNITFAMKKRPIDKIPDDYFPPLPPQSMVVLFLFQTGYAAVHLSGWNFHFPTVIERLLWHIATIIMMSSIVMYWVVDIYVWRLHPIL